MIMKIMTPENDKPPLFLGINANGMTGGHNFTFALDIKQEAHDMIAHFGLYLAYKYVPEIYSCMQRRCKVCKANPLGPKIAHSENQGRQINAQPGCHSGQYGLDEEPRKNEFGTQKDAL